LKQQPTAFRVTLLDIKTLVSRSCLRNNEFSPLGVSLREKTPTHVITQLIRFDILQRTLGREGKLKKERLCVTVC